MSPSAPKTPRNSSNDVANVLAALHDKIACLMRQVKTRRFKIAGSWRTLPRASWFRKSLVSDQRPPTSPASTTRRALPRGPTNPGNNALHGKPSPSQHQPWRKLLSGGHGNRVDGHTGRCAWTRRVGDEGASRGGCETSGSIRVSTPIGHTVNGTPAPGPPWIAPLRAQTPSLSRTTGLGADTPYVKKPRAASQCGKFLAHSPRVPAEVVWLSAPERANLEVNPGSARLFCSARALADASHFL